MTCILCDYCDKLFNKAYSVVYVCVPSTNEVVSTFHLCETCMKKGFTVKEKAPVDPKLLPPGGPKNGGLN